MSANLGNVHYWLYNQIQMIDDRNSFLVKNFKELSDNYHESLAGVDIKEALAGKHIHPGLESLITKVQTEEVKIIEDLIKVTNLEELIEMYYAHGIKTAQKENKSGKTIEETIKALKDIFLEGMPCDGLTQVEIKDNYGRLIRDNKLHTEFWVNSEVAVEKMHRLYRAWIKGALFVINPEVEYEREINSDHYIDLIKSV